MTPIPQESLKNPAVVVVGVGALGSEVCKQLAEKKITDVLIIDPDQLEEHNIRCSSIYQDAFSRKGNEIFDDFKGGLLLDEIKRRYTLSWSAIAQEIADVGLGFLTSRKLILSCTDSALARVETARVAHVLGVPIIDGGVMGEGIAAGRAAWFAADYKAACYLCGISEMRRAELLTYAASVSLGCRPIDESPSMTGSLSAVHETASAMLSLIQEWQRDTVSLESSFAMRLISNTAQKWSKFHLDLPRSTTCPWHDEVSGRWRSIPEDRPFREAFTGNELCCQLLWPQCLIARCHRCGTRSEPLRRVAWVRRKAICAGCGAKGSCEPIEVIDTLASTDPRANLTPQQLGLPKQHLYLFRRSFVPVAKKDFDEPIS